MTRVVAPGYDDRFIDDKWLGDVCKVGEDAACCRYLVCGPQGFECAKFSELKELLDSRVAVGTMHALGDNCPGKGGMNQFKEPTIPRDW